LAFFDDLAGLCAREMTAAQKANDVDRQSAVVAGLATMMGRSVAVIADGNPQAIDELLTAAEHYIAAEASEFTESAGFAASRRPN
jgi:hypothetical protein